MCRRALSELHFSWVCFVGEILESYSLGKCSGLEFRLQRVGLLVLFIKELVEISKL